MTLAPEDIVRRYFDALTLKDWGGLGAICADDVVYYLRGTSPQSRLVQGRDAFLKMTEQVFGNFADARFTVEQVQAVPGALRMWRAWYHTIFTGNDGRIYEERASVIFEVMHEQITRIAVQLDEEQLRALDESTFVSQH